MFIERMISNKIRSKNNDKLIDEICQTIEKNNIKIESIFIRSGEIRLGPDDCAESFSIFTEDGEILTYVYEQHGFAPPSYAYEFAKRLAARLHLYVERVTGCDYVRGDNQYFHYRLVLEDPEIKIKKKKYGRN